MVADLARLSESALLEAMCADERRPPARLGDGARTLAPGLRAAVAEVKALGAGDAATLATTDRVRVRPPRQKIGASFSLIHEKRAGGGVAGADLVPVLCTDADAQEKWLRSCAVDLLQRAALHRTEHDLVPSRVELTASLVDPDASFEALRERWVVAPVTDALIYRSDRVRPALARWVDDVARWDFTTIAPAHFDAHAGTPADLRAAFAPTLGGDGGDGAAKKPYNAGDDQLLEDISGALVKLKVI